MNKEERHKIKRAAYHEAGHIVFSLSCGVIPDRAAVSWTGEGFTTLPEGAFSSIENIAMCLIGLMAQIKGLIDPSKKDLYSDIKRLNEKKSFLDGHDVEDLAIMTGKQKINSNDIDTITEICRLDDWLAGKWDDVNKLARALQLRGILGQSDYKLFDIMPCRYNTWLEEKTGQSEMEILNDVIKSIKGKMPNPKKMWEDLKKVRSKY